MSDSLPIRFAAERTPATRIVPLADIQAAITPEAAVEAVKAGFIAHAKGGVHCPEPMQIVFRDDRQEQHGECHVKSATWSGRPYVAVKIASGSYRNAARGLPGAGGMIVLIASDTGLPEAVLQDDCWLTNVRTAAAGALAAGLKPVPKDAALGVIGTGTQAEMQAAMICSHLGLGSVAVWGRNRTRADALCGRLRAGGLEATAMDTVREVCHASAILVTTTPATKPVVHLEDVPQTLHIVAVGADTPGKTELDPRILGRAHTIVTDAHHECLANSDFGAAVRAGEVAEESDRSFGEMLALAEPDPRMAREGISVVDLTGMGVQDLAIASLVMEALAA